MERIDSIELTFIARTYTDDMRPIGEMRSTPITIYRGKVADVWAELDRQLALARETEKQNIPSDNVEAIVQQLVDARAEIDRLKNKQ